MSRGHRELPKGRRIHVYRSGDPHFEGARVTYNPALYRRHDKFLDEVAEKVPLTGAVRSIHTPNTGTEVTDLHDLKKGGKYVAAGPKGFVSIPGGYESIGKKPYTQRVKRGFTKRIIHKHRSNVAPILIWVYCNGDPKGRAQAFPINGDDKRHWGNILYRISETVKHPSGKVTKLFDSKGKVIDSVDELVDNGRYVAASTNERFQPIQEKQRTKNRKNSRKDGTIEKIHSPGLKARVPKPVKLKKKKSSPETDTQSDDSEEGSPISRQRSSSTRSERTSTAASEEPQRNSTRRNSMRNANDPLPESPMRRMSLSEFDNKNLMDNTTKSNLNNLYETLGSNLFEEKLKGLTAYNEHTTESDSDIDSGRGSFLFTDESRPDSVFRASQKSRRPSTTRTVDLDADEGGIFRAKSRSDFTSRALPVLEDSRTKIEIPIDLLEAKEVMEEAY